LSIIEIVDFVVALDLCHLDGMMEYWSLLQYSLAQTGMKGTIHRSEPVAPGQANWGEARKF